MMINDAVFALFRAEVRVIDQTKRTTLSRLLLDSVTSTAPGEKLDEKLANLTFSSGSQNLPPPSSDEAMWWDDPRYPGGVFVPGSPQRTPGYKSNPFESSNVTTLSSSPSSSEEELYHALTLQRPMAPMQAGRRPPPPPPLRGGKGAVKDIA